MLGPLRIKNRFLCPRLHAFERGREEPEMAFKLWRHCFDVERRVYYSKVRLIRWYQVKTRNKEANEKKENFFSKKEKKFLTQSLNQPILGKNQRSLRKKPRTAQSTPWRILQTGYRRVPKFLEEGYCVFRDVRYPNTSIRNSSFLLWWVPLCCASSKPSSSFTWLLRSAHLWAPHSTRGFPPHQLDWQWRKCQLYTL